MLKLQICSDKAAGVAAVTPACLVFAYTGAPMLGQLDCSGVGTALEVDAPKDEQALKKTRARNNEVLLRQLREVGCCTAIACHHRAVWAG